VGKPQVEYSARCDQWVPRGDVVRCVVTCDDEGQAAVDIDGRQFTMEELGRMLLTHEGWGMRLTFVDEEHVDEDPAIEIGEPDDEHSEPPRDDPRARGYQRRRHLSR
jgi:hypothetical protein